MSGTFLLRRRRGALIIASRLRDQQRDDRMADGLLEAVRGLHLAHPELGPKPLLAKLQVHRHTQHAHAHGSCELTPLHAAGL